MKIHRKANILVLVGVFAADFESITVVPTVTEPMYSTIPKKFINVTLWPQSTNLKCWSCDLIPPGQPLFIPQNPELVNGEETCDVLGNFCNGSCAATYISHMPEAFQWDLLELLSRFESKFTGVRRRVIPKGPPKTEMSAYCGNGGLTVKQWRDKVEACARDYTYTPIDMSART